MSLRGGPILKASQLDFVGALWAMGRVCAIFIPHIPYPKYIPTVSIHNLIIDG